MDPASNAAFIIFASISPGLIALVKQQGWSKQVNACVALACYALIGAAGALVSGQPLTLDNAVQLIATATVVGSASYNLIWRNLYPSADGRTLDERITDATSFVKP
jgi:hypothetical protein